MASLLNYTAYQREELTAFHNKILLHYSVSATDDGISPEDSVSRIGPSQLSNSSAQKKRVLLQQQLRDAETEAENVVEIRKQEAEMRRQDTEREMHRQHAERDMHRQEEKYVDKTPRRKYVDKTPRQKCVDRRQKLRRTCVSGMPRQHAKSAKLRRR